MSAPDRDARQVVSEVPVYGSLVTLDPGSRSPAIAFWLRRPDGWHMVRARRGALKATDDVLRKSLLLGEQLLTVASAFVTEYPEVRGAGRGKGSAADLIPMAMQAGALGGMMGVLPHMCAVIPVSEWAGSTPKAESGDPRREVRGARIWEALSQEERDVLLNPLDRLKLMQHDVFDAVGIGLYVTGRVGTGVTQRRSRVGAGPLVTKP